MKKLENGTKFANHVKSPATEFWNIFDSLFIYLMFSASIFCIDNYSDQVFSSPLYFPW